MVSLSFLHPLIKFLVVKYDGRGGVCLTESGRLNCLKNLSISGVVFGGGINVPLITSLYAIISTIRPSRDCNGFHISV